MEFQVKLEAPWLGPLFLSVVYMHCCFVGGSWFQLPPIVKTANPWLTISLQYLYMYALEGVYKLVIWVLYPFQSCVIYLQDVVYSAQLILWPLHILIKDEVMETWKLIVCQLITFNWHCVQCSSRVFFAGQTVYSMAFF